MAKESFILKFCDFITKYFIYALIFLIPIFFLPFTSDALDFNKQALLILLVFVSFFSLLVKFLIVGKIELKKGKMNLVAGILFLVYLLAMIFSIYFRGSFWGIPGQVTESITTVIGLFIFYFLIVNTFSEKNVITSLTVLFFSALIAELLGVFQLFSLFIIPLDFTKSVSFNTIGSVGSLGFFAAILLPLSIVLIIITKKWWKILFAIEIVLSTLILILVNYSIIWWVLVAGVVLILILGVLKRNLFDGRWMVLPMFFLTISLIFLFFSPLSSLQISQKANEVFLSQDAGWNIATQALKQNPLLGSGLGTFAYDFSKFKNTSFSASSLWSYTFNKSSSKFLTVLTTTGVLGILALLVFIILPIFYGIKFIVVQKSTASANSEAGMRNILLLGLSVALIEMFIAFIFYNSNLTLDFILFFVIALLVNLIHTKKKEYVLTPSSVFTLTITLSFVVFFILGLIFMILIGQRYTAEVNYYNGLVSYSGGQKTEGLKDIETAVNLNPKSDLYFRQLSQIYLLNLQDEISNTKSAPTDQQKKDVQAYVSNSINAGKIATDLNPKDVANWSSRGYVYQNLFGISQDASKWAISSYDSALKLDPNNPYLFLQEGNVYFAESLSATADQKNQLLGQAQTQLEKSINLNPNYSDALYSLGLAYDAQGQKDKAVASFVKLQQLNPKATAIQDIINNINSGKPALQLIATPKVATPAKTK